jgi:SAM-dependent methyltransferase
MMQPDEPLWKSKLRRGSRVLFERGPGPIWHHARQLGPSGCARFFATQLRYAVGDALGRRFDSRHGVETTGIVPRDQLEIVGDHSAPNQCSDFLSTPTRTFRRILAHLPEQDFSPFTFIDFGCGKGRALLLAATRNFRRVIGIEHAPMLAATAERNVQAWRGERLCNDIRVLCADATTFELPPDPCVLYFCGPFGGNTSVLRLVLKNIAASLRAYPRRTYLLFLDGIDQRLPDPEVLAAGFRRRSKLGERWFDPGATRLPFWHAVYEAG